MISLFSSVGSSSACNTVVGAGSLPTARKWAVGLVNGQKWRVNTSSLTSMSFLNAAAPTRLIEGGFHHVNGMVSDSSGKGRGS